MDKVMVIGIAGGTGSGKTTITKKLIQHFGEDVSVIHHDNYYKAHHDMSYEERSKLNYDHPDSFDTDMLVEAVKELKRGHSVVCPVYDYTVHDRSDKTVTVNPAKVVIVEGILIFSCKELCQQMDIKIYVDTDADVRILRRIMRDVRDRGRSLDSVVNFPDNICYLASSPLGNVLILRRWQHFRVSDVVEVYAVNVIMGGYLSG